ncbi:MAG TPA: hypothetical protein VGJ73_09480, partial [Verrucomicrobiae bacterium]
MTDDLKEPSPHPDPFPIAELGKPVVRKWATRGLIIAASLVVWFWTQSLIGHRPAGNGIGDKVHEFTQPANDYLQTHPQAA